MKRRSLLLLVVVALLATMLIPGTAFAAEQVTIKGTPISEDFEGTAANWNGSIALPADFEVTITDVTEGKLVWSSSDEDVVSISSATKTITNLTGDLKLVT